MSKEKKVVQLENEYTNLHEEQKKARQRIFYRNRRLRIFGVVCLIIFATVCISLGNSYIELQTLRDDHTEVVAKKDKLEAEQEQLEHDVALLKDEEYVLKLARSKFYMTKEGEQVFAFQQSSGDEESTSDDSTIESNEDDDTSSTQEVEE